MVHWRAYLHRIAIYLKGNWLPPISRLQQHKQRPSLQQKSLLRT
jgi:shikimate kinase